MNMDKQCVPGRVFVSRAARGVWNPERARIPKTATEYIRADIAEGLASALQQMLDEAAHLAGFSTNTETAVIGALTRYRKATK